MKTTRRARFPQLIFSNWETHKLQGTRFIGGGQVRVLNTILKWRAQCTVGRWFTN